MAIAQHVSHFWQSDSSTDEHCRDCGCRFDSDAAEVACQPSPAVAFVVYIGADGVPALCEGGVYSSTPQGEYAGNTIEEATREALRLGAGYGVVTDATGVWVDETVASSLEVWQLDIIGSNPGVIAYRLATDPDYLPDGPNYVCDLGADTVRTNDGSVYTIDRKACAPRTDGRRPDISGPLLGDDVRAYHRTNANGVPLPPSTDVFGNPSRASDVFRPAGAPVPSVPMAGAIPTERNRFARWLNHLDGLSEDPLRRAAQIALSAINEIDFGELANDTGVTVAYEALCAALSEDR